ncbi:hypothetical protein [Streptomyces sp. NPDC055085]
MTAFRFGLSGSELTGIMSGHALAAKSDLKSDGAIGTGEFRMVVYIAGHGGDPAGYTTVPRGLRVTFYIPDGYAMSAWLVASIYSGDSTQARIEEFYGGPPSEKKLQNSGEPSSLEKKERLPIPSEPPVGSQIPASSESVFDQQGYQEAKGLGLSEEIAISGGAAQLAGSEEPEPELEREDSVAYTEGEGEGEGGAEGLRHIDLSEQGDVGQRASENRAKIPNYSFKPEEPYERTIAQGFALANPTGQLLFVGKPPLATVHHLCSDPRICENAVAATGSHSQACTGLFSPRLVEHYFQGEIGVMSCRGLTKDPTEMKRVGHDQIRKIHKLEKIFEDSLKAPNDQNLARRAMTTFVGLTPRDRSVLLSMECVMKWQHVQLRQKSEVSPQVISLLKELNKQLDKVVKRATDFAQKKGEADNVWTVRRESRKALKEACENLQKQCTVYIEASRTAATGISSWLRPKHQLEGLTVLRDVFINFHETWKLMKIIVERRDADLQAAVKEELELWNHANERAMNVLKSEDFSWELGAATIKEIS